MKIFYVDGNNLLYQVDDQASNVLISGSLHSLVFTFPAKDRSNEDVPGGIGIDMVLRRSGKNFPMQRTFVMRNVLLN